MNDRTRFAAYLTGEGIEIGACHTPFPVDSSRARVRFVDRLTAAQIRELFPEIPDPSQVVAADHLCNLDRPDDLVRGFGRSSLDFVIASHILEHVANPIAALEAFDAVLRLSGRVLLVIPDNGSKIDRGRLPTPLATVVRAWQSRKDEVTRQDAEQYLAEIGVPATSENVDLVLARSFHLSTWTFDSFHQLLAEVLGRGLVRWILLDCSRDDGHEHIFLFGKTRSNLGLAAQLATADRYTNAPGSR